MKFKKNAVKIFFALAIAVISIWTFFDFSLQLQNVLTNSTYKTLSEISLHYNKAFVDRIAYNTRTMNVLSGSLHKMCDMSKEEIMRVLQNAVDDGGYTKMIVCNTDGNTLSNDGISINVSHRDYFKKALRGEINISDPLVTTINHDEAIVIAVPICTNKDISGVLFGVYPLETAGEQLLDSTYYSDGYGFIISPDGKILLSSKHKDKLCDEKNLFDFFDKTTFSNFSVSQIKSAMANGESKSFSFKYDGKNRFVTFMPSTVNDWYTFSIASDTLILRQEKVTNKVVLKLLIRIALIVIAAMIWIFLSTRRHNTEIVTANQRYQSLLSNINGGMIVASHAPNIDGTLVKYVSHGFTDMTGYTLEDINTLFQGKYLSVLIDEDRNVAFDTYLEQLSAGKTYHMPYRIRKKDGGLLWVMDNGYVVNDGKLINNHSIITDISTLKQQEEALRLSENRFSVAIHASSGALFEVDLKKKLYTHFENAERIFGTSSKTLLDDTRPFSLLSFDDFVKTTTDYFFHPDDRDIANKGMELLIENKTVSYEARLHKYDNTYIWARIDLSLTNDEYGDPSVLIGFMSDINDIKKESERLEVKVNSDSMTGIYNKSALVQLTNKILRENQDKRHALIVIDIDNFKGLNDTLGHAFGDVVLIESAAKLKSIFRGNDIVGRMGGDEFAVVMENIPDKNLALKKAAEISKTIRQTYSGQKNDYSISCSIGVVIIEENNTDPFETLYRKADAALYQAKECGKDMFVLYDESEAQNYPIESKRTNDEELQNLATYHNPEEYIFELLYTTKNFDASINKALAVIGRQYNVSRAYIFENDDLNRYTSNIYEWCNDDISPQISNLQNIEFSLGETSLLNCYDKNGLLYCSDVRELPSTPRKILEAQGVLSTLQMIISDDEKIYGFIGFDECTKYRVWTTEEIEKLSFLSKVLSVFLFKEKAKVALLKNLNTRLKILDVLPDYICVVNPETHSIVYSNSKLQKLIPTVQTGAFCFSSLRGGQNSPCKTCLVERIKIGDTDNLEIISEDKNIRLPINALTINWTNDQQMVLLYGTAYKTI